MVLSLFLAFGLHSPFLYGIRFCLIRLWLHGMHETLSAPVAVPSLQPSVPVNGFCSKVSVVCSAFLPWKNTSSHGATGLLISHTTNWPFPAFTRASCSVLYKRATKFILLQFFYLRVEVCLP